MDRYVHHVTNIPDIGNAYCEGCPFYHWGDDDPDDCSNPQLETTDLCGGQRTHECLSAYPKGAVVKIKVKR